MTESTKRPFGSVAGSGSSGSGSGPAAKKAKPIPPTASTPSAFSKLMNSAASKSTSHSTVFDPSKPTVIRVPSAPSLEHWLWLDPFVTGSEVTTRVKDVEKTEKSVDTSVESEAIKGKAGGTAISIQKEIAVDAEDDVQFIGQSQPQPNAEAGPSTLTPTSSINLPTTFTPANTTLIAPNISHPIPNAKPKIKLALFDLDGTLIRTRSNAVMPRDASDWEFLYGGDGKGSVKDGLRKCWKEGYHLVIISNQNISSASPKNKPLQSSALENWREKIKQICGKLPADMPLRIMAGTQKDEYRKPRIGMFETLERLYTAKGMEIDIDSSYYVGDAAGRLAGGGRKADHNDTDFKFALNVGLRFLTPEQFFGQSTVDPKLPYPRGFDARAYMQAMEFVPEVTPTTTPIVPKNVREIVLFVGSPAAGKTTFFNRNFKPKGYVHVNQDTLKSRDKCLARVEEVIKSGMAGCVVGESDRYLGVFDLGGSGRVLAMAIVALVRPSIRRMANGAECQQKMAKLGNKLTEHHESTDNTNRDRRTRKLYVDLAKVAGVPIRCFRFMASAELAMHNNAYRAWCQRGKHDREFLPSNAIYSFTTALEEPALSEGFAEIRQVNFHFEGEEEDVKRWCRWMQ